MDKNETDMKASNLTMQDYSTLKFVGLNILTLNTLMFIWMWKLINTLSNKLNKSTNIILAISIFAIAVWSDIISGMIDEEIIEYFPTLIFWGYFLVLVEYVLLIILSLRSKSEIENYLNNISKPYNLKTVWCFIFPFYYQYYILYNIDKIKVNENHV